MSFHKGTQISGVIEQISGVSWRVNSIVEIIARFVPEFLSIVVGITLAASINGTLAGVLVVGVVLYCMLLSRVLMPIAELDSKAHKLWNGRWNDSAAAIHQIESVKQASSEEHETEKINKEMLGKTVLAWNKIELIWSNIGFFQRMIVLVTQFAVFFLSVYFVSEKIITVGELVALNGYAMMFFGPFVSLGYSWQTIQNGVIKAAQAEKAFGAPQEIYSPKDAVVPKDIAGNVEFKNVSFRYEKVDDKNSANILSDINIKVNSGETVAFVGESGVGKSTAISLMSAYAFPTEGEVLIDGIDTRKIDLLALRERIGVVPQEVALFNDTIKVNIKYGAFSATDEEVRTAAKQAHIDEFIEELPNGYETVVGERGVKLSVGQKQRVAIARAILRNPRILILDEPTSALDSKTERFITKSMEELMKGRTTFIIAHRLSTVRKADKIFVFKEGRIAETGTHDELMSTKSGVYKDMYEHHVGLK